MSSKSPKPSTSTSHLEQDNSESECKDPEGSPTKRYTSTIPFYEEEDSSLGDCVNPNTVFRHSSTSSQHPHCDSNEDPQEPIPSTSRSEPGSSSNLHINSNECNVSGQFKCSECGRVFRTKRKLNKHMAVHSDSRPFKCSKCAYAFKNQLALKRHESEHSELSPHKCKVCEKSFIRNTNLTRHMKTHANLKPYKCHHCQYASNWKHDLKTHITNIHTCKVCKKVFKNKYLLNWHRGTHDLRIETVNEL